MKREEFHFKVTEHVERQLSNIFGPSRGVDSYLESALKRSFDCFSLAKCKYYYDENEDVKFSVLHSGQYAIFLYFLANTIYKLGGDLEIATKVYYLNKIINSVDWYYEIDLPRYWNVEHPIGSVLGRAEYKEGLFIYQNTTIGGNNGRYPVLGKNLIMYANATVLGETSIGDNVIISTGSTVVDEKIPSNCLVFGKSPNLIIKHREETYIKQHIQKFWKKI